MPIILFWNALVAGALPQFGRWFDSFERSSFLLERWFEARLPEAERIERLTSRFPVFGFYDDAVTARVSSFQAGALFSAPVAGVGAHVERALGQWNVGRRLRAVVRENQLLPEMFRVLEAITAGVLASIGRFRVPTAATFDPARRSAADLPGLAALAFRALATSEAQILGAATQVRDAFRPAAAAAPAGAAPPTADGAAAAGLPLAFQLETLGRYLVAGLLVLPALAGMLGTLGSDTLLRLRYALLDVLEGIERRAFAFRRRILGVFVHDLQLQARKALVFLLAAREVAVDYVRFYARVGIAYLRGVIDGVGTLAAQLGTFWTGLVGVIQAVVSYGNAFVAVDIQEVMHNALVTVEDAIETIDTHLYPIDESPTMYHAPEQFPVTIGDLVLNQGTGARANAELTRAVALLTAAWNGAHMASRATTQWVTGQNIQGYLAALQGVTRALALPRAGAPTQPALTLALGAVPDLKALIIDPLRAGATAAVEDAVTGVGRGIEGVVVSAVGALDGGAAAFDQAAAQAARLGSLRLLRRLTSNTDALLTSLFAGQAAPPVAGGLAAVAGVYAQWLIQGGFDTIGAALSGFVGMMLDEWTRHLQEGSDTPVEVSPTSPRRLLARARLGRVHTPEVRIVASSQELGRPLAGRIADGFQGAVQSAYAAGQARLGQMVEAAP